MIRGLFVNPERKAAQTCKKRRSALRELMPKEDIAMDGASARPALERDPVKIDPNHYKVELENDKVRVVRIRYGPHEKSPMHQHRPGVAVFLSDGEFEFVYPDGRRENIQGKTGQFLSFTETWEHEPRSLTGTPFEALYVELKT
jgi:quercetin dioxygenase-like cupin family protein